MCVKNSMPYLMSSVRSFQSQKYKNKELIVVYAKSDDNSEYYLKSLKDKNIRIYEYNQQIYKSLNYGIKKTSGDVIGILHSDDVFFSELILNKVAKSFKKKSPDFIFGNILYSDTNNLLNVKRIWDKIKIKKKFELPPHTSTFIKKFIYKKHQYKTNYKISSDTDFLLDLLNKKYKFSYLNEYVSIMRYGGLSTNLNYLFLKTFEDIKIFYSHNLTLFDYFMKIFVKTKQIINNKNFKISKYHTKINNFSQIKFFDDNNFYQSKGKVISALNLAFLTYNHKYKLRTHNYEFWPDGIFAKILTNKNKIAGRYFIKKILVKLNKRKVFDNIYILGNLNTNTKDWINKNLERDYIFKKLPYGETKTILTSIRNIKIKKKSLVILTLPTPKQEIIGNEILKKSVDALIICIGGSLNILSGSEKPVPQILHKLYLEWLWRLRFDTKRRFLRLGETFTIFIKILIFRKIDLF